MISEKRASDILEKPNPYGLATGPAAKFTGKAGNGSLKTVSKFTSYSTILL